jgi:hypothetical protein
MGSGGASANAARPAAEAAAAAHDRDLFGHGEPQEVIRWLCGFCRLDGCLGNERYWKEQAAQA